MMVVVEGWGPLWWSYKQLRHLARTCPQNSKNNDDKTNSSTTNATLEPGDHPNNPEKKMDLGYKKKKKTLNKRTESSSLAVAVKTTTTEATVKMTTEMKTTEKPAETPATETTAVQPVPSPSKKHRKEKRIQRENSPRKWKPWQTSKAADSGETQA